ncbi:MAG: hypothetical protein C4317_09315 [Acidimicrobiia bacterium]
MGVALVVRSELLDAVKAAVKPSLGFTTASLVAITAIFGTTISPYLFFWQNAEEVEEEREQNAAETTRENQKYRGISEMRADVASGMGAGVLVAMCIIYAAGASLNLCTGRCTWLGGGVVSPSARGPCVLRNHSCRSRGGCGYEPPRSSCSKGPLLVSGSKWLRSATAHAAYQPFSVL